MNQHSWKKICLLVVGSILLYWLLEHYQLIVSGIAALIDIFSPFILGGAIAFIFNVPMSAVERRLPFKKKRRAAAYGITVLLVLLVLTFCLLVIIPQVSETIGIIAAQIPIAFRALQTQLEKLPFPEIQRILEEQNFNWSQLAERAVSILQSSATGLINSGISIVGGVINGVTSFVIGFVFSAYVLLQKEKLARHIHLLMRAFLPQKTCDHIWRVGQLSNRIFSKFISGQCLEALILGCMFFVSMLILQIPYALVISILISITALVPIVGAFIGCMIGALLILMVSPLKALIFVILFLVLQQVEGNLIYPHVVGNSVGLPSIWVLVAVTVGGSLMGIVGMLVFIPLCSVVYVLCREQVQKRVTKRRDGAEKEEEAEDLTV